MIEEKETLTGNIESTQSIEGKVNVGGITISPTLQEKEWLNTKFSRLTNVKTVEEYEQ